MLHLSDVRIIVDSSADLWELADFPVVSVPLKIHTAVAEYVDNAELDVSKMMRELAQYRGKSTSACPSMGDFLNAFGDAKYVFCITITAKLSGSFNVATSAARAYEEEHPDRRVCVIDSRNTGPGMKLLAERIAALLREGADFDTVCQEVNAYRDETELLFLLESLTNLANNGRVSRPVAMLAGLLGIRMLGRAVEGEIKPIAKPRGEKRSLEELYREMRALGYKGGKLRISHCENHPLAEKLSGLVRADFPEASIELYPARALCSFYAERGGIIVGFEISDK